MGSSQALSVTTLQKNCGHCERVSSCMGLDVPRTGVSDLSNLTSNKLLLHKGDRLFSAGDQISSLYAVHSGVIKTYRLTSEGDRQVLDFYFAGQIVDLDALYDDVSTVFAEALDTASVCAISIPEFKKVISGSAALQDGFIRRMSKVIRQQMDHTLSVGLCDATQRMARLLYRVSAHYRTMGYSPLRFELPMSRVDMASHLGLAVETISRQIRKLRELGLVEITGNHVVIKSMPELMRWALVDDQSLELREVA